MTGRQWLLLAGIVILGAGVLFFVMKGVGIDRSVNLGGGWVCQNGVWAKFGETNDPRPLERCE